MKRYSRITRGVGGLLAALVCAVALFGCAGDETTVYQLPAPTTGSLNVQVTPASADVTVTGPGSYTTTFQGNRMLTDLAPGQYTATVTELGYVDDVRSINVVVGQTSSIQMILQSTSIISEAPRAVYRDGDGNLIPLDASSLQSGSFVFYAWLQDRPLGIFPANLTSTPFGDPGMPLLTEQAESAPSFTQNLAGAYVGFMDATGIVRPVIGADVRWEIDQWWSGRVNSTQFGTSDDNRVALGYGVSDDQADTRTNNARLAAERFPLIATEYPLYNQTGIANPFADGFTWVTLFSPDTNAKARIVAVATINGEEIGKQILYKNFAPAPKIEITKTVDTELVNLDTTDTVTWTVKVKNTGTGDATDVSLSDFLASGAAGNYTLNTPLPGGAPAGDGFTYSFPLASEFTPAPPQTAQLLGNAQSFAVLGSESVSNTGSSVVSGDVGVSAGTAITGFPPGIVLNGTLHNNDAAAAAAQVSLTTAYVALGERECNDDLTGQDLGGKTLTPGVYCFSSTAGLTGTLVLDAQNNPAAEFVFKIGSALTTAAGATVSLINGASPCNVYWHLGSSATLGANTFFVGNILAQASVTAITGTTANISGRLLARTGAVSLDTIAISAPLNCVAAPGSTETLTFTATVTAPGTYCNEAQILSYSDATNTWTPVGLNDQACFTAVGSDLSIVKDFVADDNTTSLGKSLTVAANVPAKLRVRVINNGTGGATGVQVNDALTSGTLANYQIISVSSGTPNSSGGFDIAAFDLAAGASTTVLFTVAASADGTYCDTATISATSGTIAVGSDEACLTVATPNLTITKTDAPGSVLPGATYTSTIVVTNDGNATAKNVVISDLLGLNSAANVWAIYVSSSLNNTAGTLVNNTVTANTVDILAGESITFTVVSRIPLGAVSGTYCDTATVTSSNAVTKQASDCVDVPAFSALQTELIDLTDPVAAGSNVTYFSTLYVEELSNEGVNNTKLTYSFGLVSPTVLGIPGVFQVVSTKVYLDSKPIRDPVTGLVVSDTSNATAVLLTAGTDYTVDNTTAGKQVIQMAPNVALQPDTALYVVHVVLVPSDTPTNHLYTTSYIWESNGLVVPSHTYEASSSEPTTVLP